MDRFSLDPNESVVLFDLDGTLADTDPLHALAWYEAVLDQTDYKLDRDDYLRRCVHGTTTPIDYVVSLGVTTDWRRLQRLKATYYEKLVAEHLLIRNGVDEFVAVLQAAGVPMGIVSSSSKASVETFLRLRWPGATPAVVVSRDDGVTAKPDPAAYLLALDRVHRPATRSLAIENSPHGIASAKAAGLRCIAVANDVFSAEQLAAADAVVAGFTDLNVSNDGGIAIEIHP